MLVYLVSLALGITIGWCIGRLLETSRRAKRGNDDILKAIHDILRWR